MKAVILTGVNKPLVVDEIIPCKLGFGQVGVRVLVSGICGAQLQEIAGLKDNREFMPHLIGHEGCGMVERIGIGVNRVKIGDKVVMHWRKADGIEADCAYYDWRHQAVGAGRVTTLSEYAVVSENRITPVPIDTPDELCALLGCSLSTALGTLESEARLKPGESILIVGTGGLGINLIRCARMMNADLIVAADIYDRKKKLALEMGATKYINSAKEKLSGGFDVIIDTAGAGNSMADTLPLLNPSGRFIMVGQPRPGRTVPMRDARHMFAGDGKTIKATQGGGFRPHIEIPRYIRLHQSGALSIGGIITKRLPLKRINDGIDMVRRGEAGRILIDMR